MLKKFLTATKYILGYYLYETNKLNDQINLIIVDGPTAVSVTEVLSQKSGDLNFFIPVQYIPLVADTKIDKSRVIYPSLYILIYIILSTFVLWFFRRKESLLNLLSSRILESVTNKNRRLIANIVTYNERGFLPSFAIHISKLLGIRSCCIQHGAIVEKYFPINVDVYFTWSDYFSSLINQRHSDVKTVNVGRLDYKTPMANSSSCTDFPLVVLQPGDVSITYELVFKDFLNIIETCLSIYNGVVLRPHPNDNILDKLRVKLDNDNRIFIDNEPLSVSLSKRKVVISLYSTVLIEASISDCIAIQYINYDWYVPMFKRSTNLVCGREALQEKLLKIFNQKDIHEFKKNEQLVSLPDYKLFFNLLTKVKL